MPDPTASVISRRGGTWLAIVALASLLAGFWLLLYPSAPTWSQAFGADGYSRSAIGHLGLIQWLRAAGEPVTQSTRPRSRPRRGLLVLAEPVAIADEDAERIGDWIGHADAVLVVLPKRRAVRDDQRPEWLREAPVRDLGDVQRVAGHVRDWQRQRHALQVIRSEAAGGWRSRLGLPAPTVLAPVQLLRDTFAEHEVLWRCDQGVLLARVGAVHVLSDPDILANHGLGRGDNAEAVLAMLRRLRAGGSIVFEESIHGHTESESVWQVAGQFPYVLVPAQLLLLFALLLWIGNGRFGPTVAPAAAIAAGKAFLIDNIATLLQRGSADRDALRRYARLHVRRAAERLHAPSGLDDAARQRFVLERVRDATRRQELAELLAGHQIAGGRATIVAARELRHRLEELLHGTV